MHIHTTSATPISDSLAGFQAAQTATALRRARELSDAAARLRAQSSVGASEEDTVSFASLMAANPAAQSQTIASVSARQSGERAPGQEQDLIPNTAETRALQDSPSQDAPARSSSEQLSLQIAWKDEGRNTGSKTVDSGQPASVFRTQEPSRASPNSVGESAANSNDWLRPVSFWA
jgi:hypothetical protein